MCLWRGGLRRSQKHLLPLFHDHVSSVVQRRSAFKLRFCDHALVLLQPPGGRKKGKPQTNECLRLGKKNRRRPTLPQARPAVPSAMGPFTSVFGMGTGVSSPLRPPEKSAA